MTPAGNIIHTSGQKYELYSPLFSVPERRGPSDVKHSETGRYEVIVVGGEQIRAFETYIEAGGLLVLAGVL